MMNKNISGLLALVLLQYSAFALSGEASGSGSMIAGPLIRVWADGYGMHAPGSKVKYQGTNPAAGIKSLLIKEVEFGCIDMPLKLEELKKDELKQFPIALGAIAPVVNLPNVYPGQFKLDAQLLGDILLGKIRKWNDPAIVALNPNLELPDANIILVHRASPPGISTIIGDYLAKTHPTWKSIKGDGMAGTWPEGSIEVKTPIDNVAALKKTKYAFGYLNIPQIMKNQLSYAQMKNQAGKYVSPSDENVVEAATNADWTDANGFAVVLTNQPGANSWPLSMASYVIMHKYNEHPERTLEALKYFKYSLRYGGLKAIQYDYIPLPESVKAEIRNSWSDIVDAKSAQIMKE